MTPEDLEGRLQRYGESLEDALAQTETPAVAPHASGPSRWMRPVLAVGAVAAAILGVVGVIALRDEAEQSGVVASAPEDVIAGQQCLESYEMVVRESEERDDQFGPTNHFDPTIQDATAVTLRTAVEPDMATVILRGESQLVWCLVPDNGPRPPLLEGGSGEVGIEPGAMGVEVWGGTGGIGVTNGPVSVRSFGRAGGQVEKVALTAGAERSPGVLRQGWFLVEMTLLGSLEDLNEIVLEWTTTTGSIDSKVLLAYDEDLPGFMAPRLDSGPAVVRTPAAASVDGVTFPVCEAQDVPGAGLPSEDDLIAKFRDASTELRSAEELAELNCIYAPGATLTQGGIEGDLAQTWASWMSDGGPLTIDVPHRIVILNSSRTAFDAALIVRAEGYWPPIAHYELVGGSWLITAQENFPACERLPAEVHEIQTNFGCSPG